MILADRVRAASVHGDVLVLCRHAASRRHALRELVLAQDGWAHVDVASLGGTIAGLTPADLASADAETDAVPKLPADHPWAEKLANRPILRASLQNHVGRAHRQRALSDDATAALAGLPAPVAALVAAGWGMPDDLAAWQTLAATPPERVVGVGFDVVPVARGTVGAAERLLLDRLGILQRAATASAPAMALCDAVVVADVAAEARAAVAWLIERGASDALVLCQDAATADRFACAARRNGLAVADDDADSLNRHALVAMLHDLIAAFERQGDARVSRATIDRLICHPIFARGSLNPPKRRSTEAEGVAEADADAEAEADAEVASYFEIGAEVRPAALALAKPRLSVGKARAFIMGMRRTSATPAAWSEAAVDLAAAWQKAPSPDAAGDDVDDKDNRARTQTERATSLLVAERLVLFAELSALGTLDAMATLVQRFGLSQPGDVIGNAIRGALRHNGALAASEINLQAALDGAVDVGQLRDGIAILRYDAYDGRSSGALALLDVHHKGIGAAPALDPLLGEAGLRALGLATPAQVLRERCNAALLAASLSGATMAFVTKQGADGRAVVAPAQLPLRYVNDAFGAGGVGCYGLRLALPEHSDRDGVVKATTDRPVDADLGVQIDAEWVRAGARFAQPPVDVELASTCLGGHLAADDARPVALRPWLGEVGLSDGEHSAIPATTRWSATGLDAMTNCLYRGWVRNILRLRPPEEMEEDLGAREIGSAAHETLDAVFQRDAALLTRVVPDDVDGAREALTYALREEMPAKVEYQLTITGTAPSVGAIFAAEALTQRWNRHWQRYAHHHIRSHAEACKQHSVQLTKQLKASVGTIDVGGPLLQAVPGMSQNVLKDSVTAILKAMLDAPSWDEFLASFVKKKVMAEKHVKVLLPQLAAESDQPIRQTLQLVFAEAQRIAGEELPPAPTDGATIAAEAKFGTENVATVTLGGRSWPARGSVDALVLFGEGDNQRLQILDYKTGNGALAKNAADLHSKTIAKLTSPQLTFYALAAREQQLIHKQEHALPPPRSLRYEMLKKPGDSVETAVSDDDLDDAADRLGALLRRASDGDFALRPHPEGCPLLRTRGGWCDAKEACRLRALPNLELADGDDETSSDDDGES